MGCDIHLHTEVKIQGDWHHYAKYDVVRDYQLFAKMAGVRGEETPIASPRGIPKDATVMTKFDCEFWGEDGHNHSFLNADEVAQVEQWAEEHCRCEQWEFHSEYWGYFFGNGWKSLAKYPGDCPKGIEDVRFIFWFDN